MKDSTNDTPLESLISKAEPKNSTFEAEIAELEEFTDCIAAMFFTLPVFEHIDFSAPHYGRTKNFYFGALFPDYYDNVPEFSTFSLKLLNPCGRSLTINGKRFSAYVFEAVRK